MCFITKKHQNKEDLHSNPPTPLQKKKNTWLFRGGSRIFNGGLLIPIRPPTYMQIYFKLPFVCPKKLQIRNWGQTGYCCFPSTTTTTTTFLLFSLLHHHHPHISIVFTPLIVFLPQRPKRLTSGQNSQNRPKRPKSGQTSHTLITFLAGKQQEEWKQ